MSKVLTTADVRTLISAMAAVTGPTITDATNASPSVVTAAAHGLQVGDVLLISGVTGNTNLNGLRFVATVPDADTFTMNDFVAGSAVNGNGVTAGTIVCKRITNTLRPGDLGDLTAALAQRPSTGGPFADNNRAAESSLKTIFGL